VRTPGCLVASISDELYGPILDAVHSQPSPPKDLECIQKINHQPKQATSNFNTDWDIPPNHLNTSTGPLLLQLLVEYSCFNARFMAKHLREMEAAL